jgi:hypothetical protein
MNYTICNTQNALEGSFIGETPHCAEGYNNTSAVGTLTSYKKVVDIEEDEDYSFYDELRNIRYYGLSSVDLKIVKMKVKAQELYLQRHALFDKINNNYIPLSELIISANHSPKRYYGEVQNRVNTFSKIAKENNLVPIFMTLTLPSGYHRFKLDKKGKLVKNTKYNGIAPKESVKILTRMFARIRQDRSLKDLKKHQRLYFRVNEPHQDGTPHTHILLFVPSDRVQKVKRAYKRLYDNRANDIQVINDDIKNSTAYVMKYINKLLPLSKKEKQSEKEEYLNAWYLRNRIIRFNSSRSLAPLTLYRLIHQKFSLYALTKIVQRKELTIYEEINSNKIVSIFDGDELIYEKNLNYEITLGNNLQNYSQLDGLQKVF